MRKTVFPIFINDDPEFTKRLERLRNDIWNDIKAVQPYNRPDRERRRHPLWLLSLVDDIDKHRLILPSVTRIRVATGLTRPKFFFLDGPIGLNKGDVQLRTSRSAQLKDNLEQEMTGEVLFDITSPIPEDARNPPRLSRHDLILIHHFVRHNVYPRFAPLLKPIKSIK